MIKAIFVNLPVKDLQRSKTFFEALGFHFNPKFTDDNAACLVLGDNMYSMLLTESYFGTFTDRTPCDTSKHVEVLTAIQLESREAVDAMVQSAISQGGRSARVPKDHGFMYEHAFADPDGHVWEAFWMQENDS